MNTEKLEKLKKSLDNQFIPDNMKDKIRAEIKKLEADIKTDDTMTTTEIKSEVKEIEKEVEKALDVAEKKEEQAQAKAPAKTRTKRTTTSRTKKPKVEEKPIAKKKTFTAIAKEIRKAGESWDDAKLRARKMMKSETTEIKKKTRTETDKLLAMVCRNKEYKKLAGTSNLSKDAQRRAMPRCKRVSKTGNVYYENRANRVDVGGFKNAYLETGGGVYAKGGELKGSFLAVIQVPYNYQKVVLDDFEFTEFLSKALTKKWFGNGFWNVTIEKQLFEIDHAQKIVVKIDIPVGVTQGGGLDKFEVGEFISKTLTKKWFGNGIWGVYILNKYELGGTIIGTPETPLGRDLGISYTGLVGETGAMSSGEMFMAGGSLTKYVKVYVVQGNYGSGFEDLTAHDTFGEAKKERKVYDENERNYPHRVIERRVLRSDYEKGNYEQGGSLVDGYLTDPNFGDFQAGVYADGGGVGFKERSERDSIKLAKAYQKVLDSDFDELEYNKYINIVKETQIPKKDLEKIEFYISTTPKGQRRMIDTYRYWGKNEFADGGSTGLPAGTEQHFVNYYLGEGTAQGIYARGGGIPNNYEGKTPEMLWNMWTEKQKRHFLLDHVLNNKKNMSDDEKARLEASVNAKYDSVYLMPKQLKDIIAEHIEMGQYAKGGGVKKRSLKSVIHLVDWKGEGIKKWYLRSYPTDEMGEELNDTVTFKDLWDSLNAKKNVYEIMGVGDSLIRERLFEYLSLIYNVDYDVVYNKWLESADYAKGGGVRMVGNREYPTGSAWTNEHKHIDKADSREVNYKRKKSFDGGGGIEDNAPSVYIADLEAYNNGRLVGKWFNLLDYSDADEFNEAVADFLKETGAEEYAVHDFENIPRSMQSEYLGVKDFEEIYEMIDLARDKDLPLEVVMEVVSQYDASVVDEFDGVYDSEEDFAEQLVDDLGIESFNNFEYYLEISDTDRRLLAQDMADSYVDDIKYEDGGNRLIEEAGLDVEEYEEADEDRQEEMRDEATEIVYDQYYDTWYDGLDDPYYFLVEEQGLYSADDFAKASFVRVDIEKLARELEYDYTFIRYDGQVYVFSVR